MTEGLSNTELAREVALDLVDGSCVNLGIGLPTLVAGYVPTDREIVFHCENGVVGMGPAPAPGCDDPDLVDAGKNPITLVQGGCYISHTDSFCLIRGGYIDVSVIGALEVSCQGDLANWWTGQGLPAVGGAMDLAAGAKTVYAMMRHTTKDGRPKIVESCSLPLTGRAIVSRIYTELGIFHIRDGTLVAVGLAPGIDLDSVRARTGAPVETDPSCQPLPRP